MATSANAADDSSESGGPSDDIKRYATSPARWDQTDWLYFGGAVTAVVLSHRYDTDVRTHFLRNRPDLANTSNDHTLDDAAPTVAIIAGTWLAAQIANSDGGRHESWSMLEAAGLGTATGVLTKFVAGRDRPDETSDPNRWRSSGSSFPSLHTTAAFAVGTVLAESGNDDYRVVRRALGYGLGAVTAYQRLRHNQHWLSDTVAGAAIGMGSARFVLNKDSSHMAGVSVVPLNDGVMLAYSLPLH